MQELSKEMTKAGIMEEMMEDTMAMSDDEVSVQFFLFVLVWTYFFGKSIYQGNQGNHKPLCQEMDDIAEAEVEKILFEVTKGQLGTDTAISTPLVQEEEIAGPAEVSSEEEEDDLQSRLAALRSQCSVLTSVLSKEILCILSCGASFCVVPILQHTLWICLLVLRCVHIFDKIVVDLVRRILYLDSRRVAFVFEM